MPLTGFADFSPEATETDYAQSAEKQVKELNTAFGRLIPRTVVRNLTHFPVLGGFPWAN
jgi:hypothetical protein